MDAYSSQRQARRSTRPVLIAVILAFVIGAALAGYAVWRFADRIPGMSPPSPPRAAALPVIAAPTAAPAPATSAGAQQAVEAAQIVAQQQGGLDQRLAAAEQRIARLDVEAQAAFSNAARAEGLLIAFAARRALDRGNDLGFLADQLRLRFGDAMPNAVETLLAFGRQPVTLDRLIARLDGLAPELTRNGGNRSWSQIRGEIARLFTVRHESTPSPQPRIRIERARMFLRSGRVAEAVAEIRNLPGAANAASWIGEAERYAAAQIALDLIESAAVLEPRRLRDGEGRPIG
ncbi:hypothetical protein [Qipengyuania sediminis]|uniref:hypothetical protein n=1 Tax=Qipengyuania sediminis TaxID=1532023 RepID=UPI001059CF29|nr:hypothetical protein [Qipengyuania sediminis]